MLDTIIIIHARINLMKILSFFSRATIILFLKICFATSLTVSFCEPVFALKLAKKKKSKKKKSKKKKSKKKKMTKKKSKKKKAKKKKAKKKKAAKKKAEKKVEPKPAPKPVPIPALTKFETETTYWCGSVHCDKAQDDGDAACLLSPGDKPMQCVYGNINVNLKDESIKKLRLSPETDSGMEICLYELRALCGGYRASFNNDKDIVSAECEKDNKMYKCQPAFENVPKPLVSPPALAAPPVAAPPAAAGVSPVPRG